MTSPNENYTSWHCGMKVVCIKRGAWQGTLVDTRKCPKPKYGEVCTISAIDHLSGYVCIRVEGYHPKDWFTASRFRPVQTRKTDISVFQRILSNPHKKIHNKVEA